MRRRLAGVALRLERAAVVGDDVARVVDGFWRPQLDFRQLAGGPSSPRGPEGPDGPLISASFLRSTRTSARKLIARPEKCQEAT